MEMDTLIEETTVPEQQLTLSPKQQPEKIENNHKADAKQMRVEHVGSLLAQAYQGASTLKLTSKEIKELTADFDDSEIEIRPHDSCVYLPHMILRQRLWSVFGPMEVAEICRERMVRNDSNEIAVDLVLLVRGVVVAEGIGTSKYYPKNANASFGDTIESAWSDALRRCCKKISVGVQVWRPAYIRRWLADNAVQQGGKWYRKDDPRIAPAPKAKGRDYTLRDEKPVSEFQKMKAAVQAVPDPEMDEATGLPF